MQAIKDNTIDDAILDVVLGQTYDFSVKNETFTLYPQTLGVSLLISRLIKQLPINQKLMQREPAIEILRIIKLYREIVCRVIAYSTYNTKEEILNIALIELRTQTLINLLDDEDICQLFMLILSADRLSEFMDYLGIERDKKEMQKVYKAKDCKNTVSFGGKSIFGSMLDVACERYGWTVDYVVWGVNYACLRLMLADMTNSVYLSDEERKKAHINTDGVVMNADDPRNWERIKNMQFD